MNSKQIMSFICLMLFSGLLMTNVAFSQTIPTPFYEPWDSTSFDTTIWTEVTGTTEIIDVNGVSSGTFPFGVPSDPFFLGMNGGSGTLASGVFDLSAASNFVFVYSESEHDLEPPEAVIIEYLNDLAVWDTLVYLEGTNNGFAEYEPFELQLVNLPADAYHAGFRFRFSTVGSLATTDEWFFDNIFLGDPIDYPISDVIAGIAAPLNGLTQIPTSQGGVLSSLGYSSSYSNASILANTGDLKLDISNSGTSTFSDEITGVTLDPISDSTFSFAAWDASSAAAGTYEVATIAANFNDNNAANDTAITTVDIGSGFAYDNGVFFTSVAFVSTARSLVGTRFTLTDADLLTTVTMQISGSTTPADSFSVDLYTAVNDSPDVKMANIFRGTYGDVGAPALTRFVIVNGMNLAAGDYYVIIDSDASGNANFPLGADNTALGGAVVNSRFVLSDNDTSFTFFESVANPVFGTLTPIIRTGFNEQTIFADYSVSEVQAGLDIATAGEADTVTAIVTNLGTAAATDAPVRVFVDGTQAAEVLVSLDAGATDTLAIPFTVGGLGIVTISVEAFAADDIDPTNNASSTTQQVFEEGTTFATVLIESGLVDKPISTTLPATRDTISVPDDLLIVDFEVIIDSLTHTFDGDLDMFFFGPDGTTNSELSTDNGSSGDNFIGTIFDDQAATSITTGTAPFTGFFMPETPLNVFNGSSTMGDWVLEIADDAGGDDGTLHNWSVMVTVAIAPPADLNPPVGLSAVAGDAEVDLAWTPPVDPSAQDTADLFYHDGTFEAQLGCSAAGVCELAVRFTPPGYPSTLLGFEFSQQNAPTSVIDMNIYLDPAGAVAGPVVPAVSSVPALGGADGVFTGDVSADNIVIASGDFYIGALEVNGFMGLALDLTDQVTYIDRNWGSVDGGATFVDLLTTVGGDPTLYGNLHITAVVLTPNGIAKIHGDVIEYVDNNYNAPQAYSLTQIKERKAAAREMLAQNGSASVVNTAEGYVENGQFAVRTVPVNHIPLPEDLNGYNVYRSDDGGTTFAQIAMVDTPDVSYNDNTVTNDVTYYYYVTANYDEGESTPSDTVSATPTSVEADIANHQTPEFLAAVTNRGNIGTLDDNLSGNRDPGFQWPIGTNQLFEGAIMIGAGADQVSDAARVISGGAQGSMDGDFMFTSNVDEVTVNADSTIYSSGYDDSNADQGLLADDGPNTPLPISVVETTYSYNDPDNSGYLIFKLEITNEGATTLNGVLAGMYHDWDILQFANNTGRVDFVELQIPGVNNDDSFLAEFALMWDASSGSTPYLGAVPLSQSIFQASRIADNAEEVFNTGSSPLTEANKINYMLDRRAGDPWGDPFGANDKSLIVGVGGGTTDPAGGYTINAGETITVGFAIVGGNDEADFVANGTAAIEKWISQGNDYIIFQNVSVDEPVAQLPTEFALEQNYPNPFNPTTTLKYALKENTDVTLKVYNVLGQLVKTLVNGQEAAGWKEVRWDGTNDIGAKVSSGIYLYRLEAGDFVQSRKMILMK